MTYSFPKATLFQRAPNALLSTPRLGYLPSVGKAPWLSAATVTANWVRVFPSTIWRDDSLICIVFKIPEVKFLVVGSAAGMLCLSGSTCQTALLTGLSSLFSRGSAIEEEGLSHASSVFDQILTLYSPRRYLALSQAKSSLDVAAANITGRAIVGSGR